VLNLREVLVLNLREVFVLTLGEVLKLEDLIHDSLRLDGLGGTFGRRGDGLLYMSGVTV
jgi:hypothetical protein